MQLSKPILPEGSPGAALYVITALARATGHTRSDQFIGTDGYYGFVLIHLPSPRRDGRPSNLSHGVICILVVEGAIVC
jgi:hypothetical protein